MLIAAAALGVAHGQAEALEIEFGAVELVRLLLGRLVAGNDGDHVHGVDEPDGACLAAACTSVVPDLEGHDLGDGAPAAGHAADGLEVGLLVCG